MADKNMGAKISVEFNETTSRQSLNSGETINTLWGKVKRWLSDLKVVAFSGSYNDLSDTPSTATTETDGLMSAEDKTKLDSVDDTYALKSKYGDTTINVGRMAGSVVGDRSTAEGWDTTASARGSHAEGGMTYAKGVESHAEGNITYAIANCSHAEGCSTRAEYSHAHAEGGFTIARGYDTHAEGDHTTAHGEGSHAEGISSYNIYESIPKFSNSTSIDDIITSWIVKSFTLSKGKGSHAEGNNTLALGDYSHTEGHSTRATKTAEHASGQYNQSNDDTLFSIGDGTADDARHNAFEITITGGKLHDKDIATTDDIPTSLPANGGNSDYATNAGNANTAGLIKPTLIGTDESCAYKTILDWANSVDGMGQAHTLVAGGFPSDTPVGDEGLITVETDFENKRKVVTFKSYGSGRGTYRRNIWSGEWRWDWVDLFSDKPYVSGRLMAAGKTATTNHGFQPSAVLYWYDHEGYYEMYHAVSYDTNSFTFRDALQVGRPIGYIIFR